MKALLLLIAVLIIASSGRCQNEKKLQGNWVVADFQCTGKVKDAEKIQNQVKGIMFAFNENTVSISSPNKDCASPFFKSGYFTLRDNVITFGKDKAEFKSINENKFQIIIPKQGIVTCTKNSEL